MVRQRRIPLLAEEGWRDSLIEAGAGVARSASAREAQARAKRKRDSAQPQEKHEASIEVRRNRGDAGLTTPSAPIRWLRNSLLVAQPPLCEEGNAALANHK